MSKSRRTRPGKGRAFLKFLIGLLVVFILGAGAYLFVLEYDHDSDPRPVEIYVPQPTQLTEPGATPSPTAAAEATAVPEETTVQEDAASRLMEGMSVPAQTENATFGMIDFRPAESELTVSAYLSAADISAESGEYYLVVTLMNGDASYVFDTRPVENNTGLDINPACFSGKIPGQTLNDGWYRLGLMAVDGENSCYVAIADNAYSFVVHAGTFIPYAE